jgi:hypothetical protein
MQETNAKARGVLVTILFAATLMGCSSSNPSTIGGPGNGNNPPGANSAPSISGNPTTVVVVGTAYSFTPSATDPDNDVLTFSATNLPSWLDPDSSTGTITGTPGNGDIGQFDNIVISVSDGSLSAALPAFSLTVQQTADGKATLTWTPPTQNNDGSALTDLSGYRIYIGTESGIYNQNITVGTAGIATYVIENLVPDTYYFVITAVNQLGVESDLSNEAVFTVT